VTGDARRYALPEGPTFAEFMAALADPEAPVALDFRGMSGDEFALAVRALTTTNPANHRLACPCGEHHMPCGCDRCAAPKE
jgi:hypothetical protein